MLGIGRITEKHRCDIADCFHEVKVLHAEWLALRQYAYELDINKGAYYDVRVGALNFWCGPDNKPVDWPNIRIDKGTGPFSRDYVGALFADGLSRRRVTLHFCIRAYTRFKVVCAERSATYERLLRGTREDQKWVLRQFDLLRDHVALMRKGSPK